MLTGGNPPDIFMNSDPGVYRDLKKQGLAYPLTKLYNAHHVTEHLPKFLLFFRFSLGAGKFCSK
jgi:glucose/mannose transport system substrate-binding protein